jgi:hypothetical protein
MEKPPKKFIDLDPKTNLEQLKGVGKHLIDQFFTLGFWGQLDSFKLEARIEKIEAVLHATSPETKKLIDQKISLKDLQDGVGNEIIVNTLAQSVELRNISKTEYFKSALIAGIVTDIPQEKKLFFINCLSELSIAALNLLATIIKQHPKGQNRHVQVEELAKESGITDTVFLVALLRELDRFNLIEMIWPAVKAMHQSNVAFTIQNLAYEFSDYIKSYKDA